MQQQDQARVSTNETAIKKYPSKIQLSQYAANLTAQNTHTSSSDSNSVSIDVPQPLQLSGQNFQKDQIDKKQEINQDGNIDKDHQNNDIQQNDNEKAVQQDKEEINRQEKQDQEKIVFEYEKKKSYDGSLLELFKSQFFTTHMMLEYLCKKSQIGVIDYLVNSMYKLNQSQIDFYLPQLWYDDKFKLFFISHLALNKYAAQSLKKFLLQRTVKSPNSALRVSVNLISKLIQILYHSVTYLKSKSLQIKKEADKFSIDVEMAIVNKNPSFRGGGLRQYQGMSEEQILQLFQMKQYRQEYLTTQQSFIETLISYSCQLKKFDLDIRIPSLKAGIIELNKHIEANVRSKAGALDSRGLQCFRGILFPFRIGQDDHDPCLILNILTDQLACFNTKKRSPIKLVFQTIRLSQAEKWNEKMSPVPRSDSCDDQLNLLTTLPTSRLHKQGVIEDEKNVYINEKDEEEDFGVSEQQEKENEKLRKFAKTIQGAELRMSCQGIGVTSAFPKSAIMDVDNEQIFKQNPFGDSDAVRASDIFYDRSMTPVIQNMTQKDIEALMMPNLVDQSSINRIQQNLDEKILDRSSSSSTVDKQMYLPFPDPFKQKWAQLCMRSKSKSIYNNFDTYQLKSVIVKGNDDLRQQQLALQLMSRMKQLFDQAKMSIYLRPYDIFVTGVNSGIIQYIPETISVDSLKKRFPTSTKKWNLNTFFREYFYENFQEAQKNFVESLAGYSLFCKQLNDVLKKNSRHNGNIMIDSVGHIIHVDFGFMLSNSPGGINFESAPFKITQEYIDIMDGVESWVFDYFKQLLYKGILLLRKHMDSLCSVIEALFISKLIIFYLSKNLDSKLPCFSKGEQLFNEIRDRVKLASCEEDDYLSLVNKLVDMSKNNWRTTQYDYFQKLTNNIYY